MIKTVVCVFLTLAAANFRYARGECESWKDPEVCIPPLPSGDLAYCNQVLAYMNCLETRVIKNADCSAELKLSVQDTINNQRTYLEQTEACKDYQCPLANCIALAPKKTDANICATTLSFASCLRNVVSNQVCDDNSKSGAQGLLDNAEADLEAKGCGEATTGPDCTFMVCDTLLSNQDSEQYCSMGKDIVNCLNTKIVNNDKCDATSRNGAKELVTSTNKNLDETCGATTGPDCTSMVCDTLPSNQDSEQYCSKGKDFVNCLNTKIVNNDKCDATSRNGAKELVTSTNKNLDEKCGVAGLVSSVTVCIGLSLLAYLMSAFKGNY